MTDPWKPRPVQAGNKPRGMRALVKSGDRDKVVYFANVAKHPEVFALAANFLQTLPWRDDPELSRTIIAFYTKAKAW